MKRCIVCCLMSASMFFAVSCGDGRQDSTEAAEDQNEERLSNKEDDAAEFAVEAADGGQMEVEVGTLAVTKASSPDVKAFAQMMVDEHSKANNELKSLSQQKNIVLPTAMGDEYQRKRDDLQEKSGAEFDKAYMDLMVSHHKKAIDEFQDAAEDGNDPEIKAWASSNLPKLQQHLEEAERIQKAIKNNDNE